MAEPLTIPKFRERVIHWTTAGGTEISYPVSASFKGILRLSPNDDSTLAEKEPITLFDDGIETYYRDSIDPAITQQFVRVSTSDGYFVGLRINQYEFEADSLYIIGPSSFNGIRLYTKKNNSFKLKNNTALPARVNQISTVLIDSDEKIKQDISGVDTHQQLDQSYALISRSTEEREFEYQQTTQLIRELVIESLLDIASVPTGSIHFTPISIKNYEKLLAKGNPNSFYQSDSEEPNDPIVRDYLICDGSLYKNEQFPELAKILEGERIDYWRFDSQKNKMVQRTYYNNYDTNKCFRVPDLRARFIKSIFPTKQLAGEENNETGKYTCDARPTNSSSTVDNHVHFITTGFYQSNPETDKFATVAEIKKQEGKRDKWIMNGSKPGVLHPNNQYKTRARSEYIQFGWNAYDYWKYGDDCAKSKLDSIPFNYFLSIPQEYDYQKPNCVPNVGLSSDDFYSCKDKPDNDEEVSYNDRTDYVPYVSNGNGAIDSYGMENAPEFCCMLPLIRI